MLFALILASCSSVQKFVVENETVTERYWKPLAHPGDYAMIRDTILQVHDFSGKRRLFYDYPAYNLGDWDLKLKQGDTIAFDTKHNILKAIKFPRSVDQCGRVWDGWLEPNYASYSSTCKCK